MGNRHPVPMYRLGPFLTIIWPFRTMLLVVVGQATEVLGQTCTRASFPFGLWHGVSIDDRQVCVFSSKFAYMGTGVQLFSHVCVFQVRFALSGSEIWAQTFAVAWVCFVDSWFDPIDTGMTSGARKRWETDTLYQCSVWTLLDHHLAL